MRRAAGVVAAILTLIIASTVIAGTLSAVDCAAQRCTYLALIRAEIQPTAIPTATPTPPAGVPTPESPCDQNAPAVENGAQAWMTVPSPARFSQTTVCARLIQGGQVVTGAAMSAVAHYKSTNTSLGPTTTGADGVGHDTFNIGGATVGYTVVVDVTIGGQHAQTSFTP